MRYRCANGRFGRRNHLGAYFILAEKNPTGRLRNTKGQVLVSLFNSAKGFPDDPAKAYRSAGLPAGKTPPVVVFDGLPQGNYALAVLHDEDMNGKLTTSFWGYPREGIGASNNKLPKKGKPSFEDAVFAVAEKPVELVVRIKYY